MTSNTQLVEFSQCGRLGVYFNYNKALNFVFVVAPVVTIEDCGGVEDKGIGGGVVAVRGGGQLAQRGGKQGARAGEWWSGRGVEAASQSSAVYRRRRRCGLRARAAPSQADEAASRPAAAPLTAPTRHRTLQPQGDQRHRCCRLQGRVHCQRESYHRILYFFLQNLKYLAPSILLILK